jgi:WXG100 family type VII secretion target
MSGNVIGAEIGQLHTLKADFNRHSGEVDQLLAALRGQLHNTYWKGGASERFRDAWEREYEPALRNLSQALVEAGDEVGRRADALEHAGS